MEQDVFTEAIALAKEADVAIIFVGNTTQWETEGQDLSSMTLPADGSQDALIASVAAVNPNTIVVNTTGVPVELPWLDSVPAFMQAWYAGQETGNAILDVLIGDLSPSGKLPVSWPKKYEHTGCYGNFGLDSFESRKVEYVEGVFVGYRWFDRLWGGDREVCFPFGYGLSYTSFTISDVRVAGTIANDLNEKVTILARVRNVGKTMGSETVQVYLEPPVVEGVERPVKGLVGFAKVELEVDEEKEIEILFARDGAAYWDDVGNGWRVSEGVHVVVVATSSAPDDVKARLELSVEHGFLYSA
jgi:beta-glucosidase